MPARDEAASSITHVAAAERLIFALDVPTAAEARRLIQAVDGVVSFFKIGIELYMGSGLELIPELRASGKKVFLDLKYYDVPETVKRAVARVASLGVEFLTIHGNNKIIQAAVEGRGSSALKLLTVTVLTSLENQDMEELGFECTVKDLVLRRARKAMELGSDGVVASPEEAAEIRGIVSRDFVIVTPGIRPAQASQDDHRRSGTPAEAIENGSDYLVVGRPIRNAADPRRVAQEILAEMQAAFDRGRII